MLAVEAVRVALDAVVEGDGDGRQECGCCCFLLRRRGGNAKVRFAKLVARGARVLQQNVQR